MARNHFQGRAWNHAGGAPKLFGAFPQAAAGPSGLRYHPGGPHFDRTPPESFSIMKLLHEQNFSSITSAQNSTKGDL
jgi:hypothetical protein